MQTKLKGRGGVERSTAMSVWCGECEEGRGYKGRGRVLGAEVVQWCGAEVGRGGRGAAWRGTRDGCGQLGAPPRIGTAPRLSLL